MLCNDRSRATSRFHPKVITFRNALEKACVTDECSFGQDVAVRPNELCRVLRVSLKRPLELLGDFVFGLLFR